MAIGCWRQNRSGWFVLGFCAAFGLGSLAAQEIPRNLQVRVRSMATGEDLTRQATWRRKDQGRITPLALSATPQQVALDNVEVEVSAPGFRPLVTSFSLKPEEPMEVELWLDPEEGLLGQEGAELASRLPQGAGALYGFVYRKDTGEPVAAAKVALSKLGLVTRTDQRGYFELIYWPLANGPEDLPLLDELTVTAPGMETRRITGLALVEGVQRRIEDLTPGEGVEFVDETPASLRPEAQSEHQTAPAPPLARPQPEASVQGHDFPVQAFGLKAAPLLVGMAPPSTIRVGTNCSGTSCSSVSVMSLESYVAAGLDEEWISSWPAHSLRSGAIAYRSYGAWYVYHPLRSTYDICSTTYCQVFAPDVVAPTQQAAIATAGFMLQKGGSIFRAEYSAENNAWDDPYDGLSCVNSDLSCGNGKAGSPAAGWPCLSDSVCSNRGCFGHGRGMCQWGTSRWASSQGKLWHWITDHYYNANGSGSGNRTATITSPITLPSFGPAQPSVPRGSTFTINLSVNNSAGLSHSQVMVGASLYSAAAGYLSDPAHDKKILLPEGTSSQTRLFTVPATAPTGTYNLIVALWYDVDGNNVITSGDLPLLSATKTSALTVTTSTTNVLQDGTFEGGLYGSSNYGTSGTTGPWSWTSTGNNNPISQDAARAYAGSWLAWLNGYGFSETDTLRQTVSIPTNATAATLEFYLRVVTSETTTTTAYDTLKVQVVAGTTTSTLAIFSNLNASTTYQAKSFNLLGYKGQTIQVKFVGQEDGSKATSFFIDNVAVNVSQ